LQTSVSWFLRSPGGTLPNSLLWTWRFSRKTALIQAGKRKSRFDAPLPGHSLKLCGTKQTYGRVVAAIRKKLSQLQDRAERAMETLKKMGAGDCKVRHQKPRPQICVVSKVTFFQEG
jgi:hypothetical protein